MLKRVMCLVALIVATASVALGQDTDLIDPDRPGIAEGSTTLARHRFQVEAGVERADASTEGALERSLATALLLRYGLTNAFELRVETNGFQHDSSPAGRSTGWNPTSVGFKAHLVEEDDKTHVPSVGVIGRLYVPSGSGEFRSSHATGDLRLVADMNLSEHWAINPNVGVDFDDSDQGRFTAALAALTVQYSFTPRLSVSIDGGFQTRETRGGTSSLLLDSGIAWIIGSDTQLDSSIGWGAHGTTPPTVFWSAGLSHRF